MKKDSQNIFGYFVVLFIFISSCSFNPNNKILDSHITGYPVQIIKSEGNPVEIRGLKPHLSDEVKGSVGFNQLSDQLVEKAIWQFENEVYRAKQNFPKSLPQIAETYTTTQMNLSYEADNNGFDYLGVVITSVYVKPEDWQPHRSEISLNYDLKNDRELRLGDLFQPGSAYLETIATYCAKELNVAQQSGLSPKSYNFEVWTVGTEGLKIYIQQYQIGSFANGAPQVVIPFEVLKPIARKGGILDK